MMWICRSGQQAKYLNKFIENEKIYLSWEGYALDFRSLKSIDAIRECVSAEKGTDNRTSVSNWAGQINSFANQMQIGDLVLIPVKRSAAFVLAEIKGEYSFDDSDEDGLFHSRKVSILLSEIPKNIFPQHIIYSLGAFRTLFKVRNGDEVMKIINEWATTQN